MLGDALIYGFSIYVIARSARMKTKTALIKGGIMVAFGFFTLVQVVYKIIFPRIPMFGVMGAIGFLALAVMSLQMSL